MEKLERKAILFKLIEEMNEKGSWSGETHVQKAVYFLQRGCKVPIDYDFILYKYGPFSFELKEDLIEMKIKDFISEILKPPYGPSLTPGGKFEIYRELFLRNVQKYKEQLTFVAENISNYPVDSLEKVSTALYVLKEEKLDDDKKVAARINSLKPHISIREAEDAVKKVRSLFSRQEIECTV